MKIKDGIRKLDALHVIAFCCVLAVSVVGWEISAGYIWESKFEDAAKGRKKGENSLYDFFLQIMAG